MERDRGDGKGTAGGGAEGPADSPGLLRQAQAGDRAAFESLVACHERRILHLAFRMLGDLEEAQDAAQEVLVRFHRHLGSLDPDRDPSPWLYQTTLNVCRDLNARRRRLVIVPLDEVAEPAAPDSRAGDPAGGLDRQRRADTLRRALALLPEKERAALVLRDVEDYSAAEAARLLGSSETTVRSQACRARLKLRQLLGETP